jgi:DNA polymerase-3 subunit beta
MKTATFTRAIELATRVVERRNTIPILGALRVQALGGGRTKISGTDMDMQIDVEFNGEAGWEGILPMASSVAKGLRTIGDDLTEVFPLPTDRAGCKIVSGDFCIELDCGMSASDWPTQLEGIQVDAGAHLDSSFVKALRHVRGAISTEETRYYLNGVHLHTVNAETWAHRLVATDGHRMYWHDIQIAGLGEVPKIIIPRKTISLLLGLVEKDGGLTMEIGCELRRNASGQMLKVDGRAPYVRFTIKTEDHTITVTSKTIDGSFPDYTRVVPNHETPFEAVFNTAELRRKIGALRAGASDKDCRALQFKFLKGGRTEIEAYWGAREAKITMSLPFTGDAQRAPNAIIGFNSRYVRDLLESVNGAEEVKFEFSPIGMATDPAKIKPKGMDDFTAILMPMRV